MKVSRNKRTGKWDIDFHCNNRRIRKRGFLSKADAENYKTKLEYNLKFKKHGLPKEEKIRFIELAKKYLENYSKPNKSSFKTDIALAKPLVEYFGSTNASDITKEDIDLYRKERVQARIRKGKKYPEGILISQTTVNRELTLLRATFNKAIEWNLMFSNPIGKLTLAKEEPKERILSEKEIPRLINSAREPLKSIILIALNTGMRLGEILKLEWDQVNLGSQSSFISIKKAKSRRLRRIPLNRPMIELFSRMQLKRSGSKFVFENPETRKPFTTIRTAWYTLLKRADIKDLRFHDLRHTFATYALLRGGDLIHLKETLGHTDIRTTARYAKALMEGQQKLVQGFEVSGNIGETIVFQKSKFEKNKIEGISK